MLSHTDAMVNGIRAAEDDTYCLRRDPGHCIAFKAKFSAEEPLGLMSYRHPNLELGLE